jgi:hypothetical protein
MKKIEHKVVNGTLVELETIIADLEKQGWELVSVLESHHHHHGKFIAFFKRSSWF